MPPPRPQPSPQMAEVFEFRPRWWWDPAPDWLIHRLDLKVLAKLALVQMELEQTVLEARASANKQVMEIVQPLTR